ncbi:MAG: acyl-[ACP]--phospholipid O-acyltransferase [Planctomycetaceae bacterium]
MEKHSAATLEDREHHSTSSKGRLNSPAFLGLLGTQCLGAFNDNMFRWLAVLLAKPVLGTDEALAFGLVSFTLPYLLLASPAGFLADRLSKRTVIVGCKAAEIVLMLLGVLAMVWGQVPLLFAVVMLMGAQSALFGPSKFGSIPELVRADRISAANGVMALITVVASALGFIAGMSLYGTIDGSLEGGIAFSELTFPTLALLGVAILGLLTSFVISRVPAADPSRSWPGNPIREVTRQLGSLAGDIPMLRAALGIGFFWLLASLAQMNIDVYGNMELGLRPQDVGPLLGILVFGLGLGSVLAGWWSGGKVELGIVPLGGLGIAISACLLYWTGSHIHPESTATMQSAYYWSCVWMLFLGMSAGLFNVPLEAFLQHRSDPKMRGSILAASNFLSFTLILFSAGLFFVLRSQLELSASEIFLVAGMGTLPVAIYVVVLLPDATIRFLIWLATHSVYRVRVFGKSNVPETGGALLVANHVSWVDGILLLVTSSRPIRMLAYADYVENPKLRWLARLFGVIPIKASAGPKALLKSLQTAREAIEQGELVCIFAEGGITRTGQLQSFNRGLMRIVKGTGAPVIPVYLDGLWGSIFSYRGGKFFWKKPKQWPYPVSIWFGQPLTEPDDVNQVRQAVQNLGVESVNERKSRDLIPARKFLRKCRRSRFRPKVADSSGAELTGGKLLAATLIFRRLLMRKNIGRDENMVGIFLPPSVGGIIANMAVTVMGKVAVNLNYTLSEEVVQFCIQECGIKHVLTSRKFLEKRPFKLDAELVYLEDLKTEASLFDKLIATFHAFVTPISLLERMLGLTKVSPDDLLTVIFTSGSTGNPKGVMLSHHNVNSNIEGVDQLFHLTDDDVLLGVLPFFHSFGYTGNLWLTLALNPKGVFHFNPLDSKTVGKLCEKHGVTIALATPTFLRSYLKRCTPEQFHKLDTVILGAEKLPAELAKAFEEKFGVAPSEGYGTTELSPVAAVNVPDHRSGSTEQSGTKAGTVGRAFPGVSAKVVDPDSGEDLGTNTEGLLLIQGANVMLGYLNNPEKTAEVIHDGWYNTGDFARIDDDGFIEITGRQSRFSKIGGEMVPHIRVEELLNEIVESSDETDNGDGPPPVALAVTAVPHETKGERLVVLHRPFSKPLEEIIEQLSEKGVPNIWIPSRDSFVEVEEVPLLGTGKLDLKRIKQIALDHFTTPVAKETRE